jgi:hypothetical protein
VQDLGEARGAAIAAVQPPELYHAVVVPPPDPSLSELAHWHHLILFSLSWCTPSLLPVLQSPTRALPDCPTGRHHQDTPPTPVSLDGVLEMLLDMCTIL